MLHSKTINGIDIGTSKITTIIGQFLENDNRFNIIAVSSVPALGFRKGQIINLDQASQTITQCVESAERMAGFQINNAVVSIAAPHIETINSQGIAAISNPNGEITKNDVDRSLEAAKAVSIPAGKEIIHVIPRIFKVDNQEGVIDPIGMNGIRLEVDAHLILASSPAIKNTQKCFEDIGINIDSLVYSGLATSKAALTDTEKELGVVLVDIGGNITTITIFNEGSPVFSSVIPVGASNVTNDLAIGLRLPLEDAERIKLRLNKIVENKKFEDEIELAQFGVVFDSKKKISLQMAINGIVKPRIEELFHLINEQIEISGLSKVIPAGVVLTGGGSQTVNVKETCSHIIPLPLRIAEPPKIGGIVDDILNPSYTSSIGLLMYYQENYHCLQPTNKKSKVSINGLVSKIKILLEPLLP